jgi:hypothetical protein
MPVTGFNRQTDAVTIGYAGNEPAMDWHMVTYAWLYALGKRVTGWHIQRLLRWKEHTRSQIDGVNSRDSLRWYVSLSSTRTTQDNINPNTSVFRTVIRCHDSPFLIMFDSVG